MSTREDPIMVGEASQMNNTKRARGEDPTSAEDPPAKMMKSSPTGGGGGPPLLPMNMENRTTAAFSSSSSPPQQLQHGSAAITSTKPVSSPSSKTRLPVPSQTGSPAASSSATNVVGSPSSRKKTDPPKPSTPPLPPKTGGTSTATTSKSGGGNTSSRRGGTGTTGGVVDAKCFKGLRHFSMMVCKKVEEKGETTYNEVADELVKTVMEVRKREDPNSKFDEKNIRRRVYDSINVLLAMDIISKDKKQISWKGLPSTAHHDLQLLEREEESRKKQVEAKRKALQEILLQQICFRNLVTRNKEREVETIHAEKVPLPFIVVNTNKEAIIHCNMAPDLTNVMFEYDRPFEINDDNSILTRLGMHKATVSTLREMIPEDMVTYCQEHGLLDSVLGESETKAPPPVLGLATEGANKGQYFRSIS